MPVFLECITDNDPETFTEILDSHFVKTLQAAQKANMARLNETSRSIIDISFEECPYSHVPNKKTIKIMRDAEKEKGPGSSKKPLIFFKKLGI